MQPKCDPVNPTYPTLLVEASSQKLASLQMVWLDMAGEVFGFDKTLNNPLSPVFHNPLKPDPQQPV